MWLSVVPINGIIGAGASTPLTVAMNVGAPHNLTPGTYTGSITISGICTISRVPAAGSPKVIAVNLTVTPPPPASISVDQTALTQDVVTLQDAWAEITTTGAPSGRYLHTAVWTGSKMLVWGGYDGGYLNTGGVYQ